VSSPHRIRLTNRSWVSTISHRDGSGVRYWRWLLRRNYGQWIGGTPGKRCLHCQNTDGTYGQWKIESENDRRKIGPRRGETRDVRNIFIRVSVTTRRKRGHTVEEDAPKREDESSNIKRL
jgi:hypothetical protein